MEDSASDALAIPEPEAWSQRKPAAMKQPWQLVVTVFGPNGYPETTQQIPLLVEVPERKVPLEELDTEELVEELRRRLKLPALIG